ncbi:MAG: SGNH/GDSL hydrolase family protein [Gemmatimonadales bacterium]|nr:MAG: SGNH/GDSL hydrolase family protein [Gemmatimonadales bacterium]
MTGWRTPLLTVLAIAALVSTGACQDTGAPAQSESASLRVLFIGNSLTYANNLPGTFAGVAMTGGDTIAVKMIALPNYGLIDHLTRNSGAVEAIRTGHWDFVVLQQGPSTLPINRDSLVLWTAMFDSIIRPTGAKTALFMVWPQSGSVGGYDAVRQSYQAAANAVGGVFIPAGLSFEAAMNRDATLVLFASDGYHPSPLGSYLAAITIYATVTAHDPRLLSEHAVVNGTALNVPAATVRMLQGVAQEIDAQY